MAASNQILVIACGALARELTALVKANDLRDVVVECLPAELHNRPRDIPAAVEARLDRAGDRYTRIFVGYADCGTAGALDAVLAERGVDRLPGAHCYEFYAGADVFAALHEEEPGTFYLTDYLVRFFDRIVIKGLGLDRHPELLGDYFGNYRRVVYLAQLDYPDLDATAARAAERLGLAYVRRGVGYGGLADALLPLGTTAAGGR